VDDVLSQAIAPVLRDLQSAGVDLPRVEDKDCTGDPESPSVMVWSPDGSGTGLRVDRSAPEFDRVAMVADQIQEWVIEERWGQATTNWPGCPNHPNGHPMQASTHDGVAVWICPADRMPFAPIGAL
jgi:hypothetical protein